VLAQRQLRQVGIEPTLDVAFLHAHDALGCDAGGELAALEQARVIRVVYIHVQRRAVV